MLVLNHSEQVPGKESLIERLISIVPLDQLKETPLSVITKEDLVNHFFAGKTVTVKETLRPYGLVRVVFSEDQTANRLFLPATSIDGIIEVKKEARIAYIKNNMIYVEET